jgi:hypothetical protein
MVLDLLTPMAISAVWSNDNLCDKIKGNHMKKIIIMCIGALLALQIAQGQGVAYVSNLGQTSTGSSSVGNNAWLAADFITGTNANGYTLNSVQLAMTNATDSPSDFTAMIYSAVAFTSINPGSNLETLNGSANPSTSGIYIYTDVSNLMLSPNTYYFIVLTAGTAVTTGAYSWSVTDTPSSGYNGYHWGGEVFFADSSNGSSWNYTPGIYGQFAINATAVPEPSAISLILLGSGVLFYVRRNFPR